MTRVVDAEKQPADAADEGFILRTELRNGDGELRVPLHPNHIDKLIKRGLFPKPVRLGSRLAFRRRDIRAWSRAQT